MLTEQPAQDLLIFDDIAYARTVSSKRFLNFIIDLAFFYLLIVVTAVVFAIVAPGLFTDFAASPLANPLMDRLLSLVLYALYMGAMEAIFKGKSLGKLLTGTRAVNLDGSPIATGSAFARGFSRAVPFCVLSAFGSPCNPWQDRWTDTMVIDERRGDR